MDHIKKDPELAEAMVQLLGNELKELRKKFLDVENKNDALREEVSTMIKSQQSAADTSLGDGPHSWEQHTKRLKPEEKSKEKKKSRDREGEIKKNLQKIQELEDANSEFKKQLDLAQNRLQDVVTENNALTKSLEHCLHEQSFDLVKFMNDPDCPSDYQDPPFDTPKPLPPYQKLDFDRVVKASGGCSSWAVNDGEFLWSSKGVGHCIIIYLAYIFDLKNNTVKNLLPKHRVGGVKDLFYTTKATRSSSRYYGTYRCTRHTTVDIKTLQKLDQGIANRLKSRLIDNKNLVAPIVSQLVEQLQTSGILTFHCAVFQCVGYNHAVYQGIIEHHNSPVAIPIPGSSSHSRVTKGEQNKKRGRDGKANDNVRANKKKKVQKEG